MSEGVGGWVGATGLVQLRKLFLQTFDAGLQVFVLFSQCRDGAGQLRDSFDAGFVGDCHLLDVAYLCRHDLTALRRRRTFRSDDTRLSLQWSFDFATDICSRKNNQTYPATPNHSLMHTRTQRTLNQRHVSINISENKLACTS